MFGGLLNFLGGDDGNQQQEQQQPSWKANLTGVPDSNQALQGRGLGMGLLSAAAAVSNANRPSYHGARSTGDLLAQGAAGFGGGLGQFGAAQIQQSTQKARQLLEEEKARREAAEFERQQKKWQAQGEYADSLQGQNRNLVLGGGDSFFDAHGKRAANHPFDMASKTYDHQLGLKTIDAETLAYLKKNGLYEDPSTGMMGRIPGYHEAVAEAEGMKALQRGLNTPLSVEPGAKVVVPGRGLNGGGGQFGNYPSGQAMQGTGGATAGTATPGGLMPSPESFASAAEFTASKESGKQGSNAIGYDRKGGTSYGKFQIASGTMPAFLSWLGQTGKGNVAEALRAAGNPNTGSRNGKMPEVWKQLVQSGEITDAMQEQFIRDTHVKPALLSLPDELKLAIHTDPSLQSALFSTAVQHGPGGASKLFGRAWQRSGGDKQALLRNLYEGRMTQFGSSTPEVRAAVQKRLANEGQQLAGGMGQGTPRGAIPSGAPQNDPSVIYSNPNPAPGVGETAFQQELGRGQGQRFNEMAVQAEEAIDRLAQLEVVRSTPLEVGKTVPIASVIDQWGEALGLPRMGANDPNDVVKVNKMLQTIVNTELRKEKGPQTEGDAKRFRESMASISDPQQAYEFAIESMVKTQERKIYKHEFYDNYLAEYGDLKGADKAWRDWSRENPLFSEAAAPAGATKQPAGAGQPSNMQSRADALINKYR